MIAPSWPKVVRPVADGKDVATCGLTHAKAKITQTWCTCFPIVILYLLLEHGYISPEKIFEVASSMH